MLIEEIAFSSNAYALALRLRETELREPLGLTLSAADRDGEDRQVHVAARDGGAVMGTVTLQPLADGWIKLRQMAVAPEVRGRGFGRDLVRVAEGLAAARGFRTVELNARLSARGFYEALGYSADGADFLSLGLPHVRMTRRLG